MSSARGCSPQLLLTMQRRRKQHSKLRLLGSRRERVLHQHSRRVFQSALGALHRTLANKSLRGAVEIAGMTSCDPMASIPALEALSCPAKTEYCSQGLPKPPVCPGKPCPDKPKPCCGAN